MVLYKHQTVQSLLSHIVYVKTYTLFFTSATQIMGSCHIHYTKHNAHAPFLILKDMLQGSVRCHVHNIIHRVQYTAHTILF